MTITKVNKHFGDGLNFYRVFWMFLMGAVVGTVVEAIFTFIKYRKYAPFRLVIRAL